MSLKTSLFGERSLTKVAAVFDSRDLAETAAQRLKNVPGMNVSQVQLVGPEDTTGVVEAPLSRKLEPEQAGIWRTLVRAHIVTGLVGAVAGCALYLAFRWSENPAVLSSPLISLGVMIFFGSIFGMLIGGLLTLRPDHYRVTVSVRKAIKRGRWAVVSHPMNSRQTTLVMNELRHRSPHVVRSL